ncbi:hypothetical protein BDD12DRAFT_474 [Trichophaea hybrida]|nr:hypothetical protein BDD12DRAFT_474 [Trichophaea hybrida]
MLPRLPCAFFAFLLSGGLLYLCFFFTCFALHILSFTSPVSKGGALYRIVSGEFFVFFFLLVFFFSFGEMRRIRCGVRDGNAWQGKARARYSSLAREDMNQQKIHTQPFLCVTLLPGFFVQLIRYGMIVRGFFVFVVAMVMYEL